MVTCEICLAISNSLEADHKIWNTKLHENENFIILPTIGPLIEGQTIIASKNHFLNLLSMKPSELKDFTPLVEYAKKILGNNILFAEHGSFEGQLGGSCIAHTHIHVLPTFEKYYSILDSIFPISNSISTLNGLHLNEQIDFPYIFTFTLSGNFRLYKAYNAHSQMIRKAICTGENRSDWDWKSNYNVPLINKTIQLWQQK
jgi:diadenosine tetraphosphate (Ap4A) HIT family hydrolase